MKAEKVEICFMGLLRNVDQTIMNLKLREGFEIAGESVRDMMSFVAKLEGVSEKRALLIPGEKLFMYHRCVNVPLQKCFYVYGSRVFKVVDEEEVWEKIESFRTVIHSYLLPTLRLMRLFSEGNIGMPLRYYYVTKNLTKHCREEEPEFPEPFVLSYSLDENKLCLLYDFLKDTPFPPFAEGYVELAFESYEQSYNVPNTNLAFLSLINGLEALFNQGPHEVGYSLSRNCATLISKDVEHGQSIFKELKRLYDLRCKLVHGIKKVTISETDVTSARDYLRVSLKKLLLMRMKKQEFLTMLNAKGFGQMN